MLRLEDNPPILYPPDSSLTEIEGQWWVAHTKARNEKALALFLGKQEIPYFLPLREKLTVRKGRRYKSLLPLFSGYVFFNGSEDTRYAALTSNRIAQVIEVVDQSKLVHELSQIYTALCIGAPLDPHPHLQQGDRCRVIAGPFVGMEVFLLQKKNLTKLVLQVDILGQAAAMEIDADLLEPLR